MGMCLHTGCLRIIGLLAALCLLGGCAPPQGLARFEPKPAQAQAERLATNQAIRQCVRMIQERTASARVAIKGPCRKASGGWSGVDKTEDGYRLRFSVMPADATAGTLPSAIMGDTVRVFCSADAQGTVTAFEDKKEELDEAIHSINLCWPAGD